MQCLPWFCFVCKMLRSENSKSTLFYATFFTWELAQRYRGEHTVRLQSTIIHITPPFLPFFHIIILATCTVEDSHLFIILYFKSLIQFFVIVFILFSILWWNRPRGGTSVSDAGGGDALVPPPGAAAGRDTLHGCGGHVTRTWPQTWCPVGDTWEHGEVNYNARAKVHGTVGKLEPRSETRSPAAEWVAMMERGGGLREVATWQPCLWAAGCVLGEMLHALPVFAGVPQRGRPPSVAEQTHANCGRYFHPVVLIASPPLANRTRMNFLLQNITFCYFFKAIEMLELLEPSVDFPPCHAVQTMSKNTPPMMMPIILAYEVKIDIFYTASCTWPSAPAQERRSNQSNERWCWFCSQIWEVQYASRS